jgi:hypothetical protein
VPANLGIAQPAATEFQTNGLCAPTGLTVRGGFRYEIAIDITEPWNDGDIATTPLGFNSSSRPVLQQVFLRSGILLRRILWRPWFRLIARVGVKGVDEYFLDPVRVAGSPNRYRDVFVANRDGEVFLYVNDAVVGLPWLSGYFYGNGLFHSGNRGKAKTTIRLCDSNEC